MNCNIKILCNYHVNLPNWCLGIYRVSHFMNTTFLVIYMFPISKSKVCFYLNWYLHIYDLVSNFYFSDHLAKVLGSLVKTRGHSVG